MIELATLCFPTLSTCGILCDFHPTSNLNWQTIMKQSRNLLLAALLAGVLGWSCPQTFGALGQQAYVKASNTGEYDKFGTTVAISGDTMIVGAPGESSNGTGVNGIENNDLAPESGAAYICVRRDRIWTKQAYLKASDSLRDFAFGTAVSIDGDTVVVGAPGAISNNKFGAAYVFVRSGTNWAEQAVLRPSNQGGYFGGAVGVSSNVIVIGAYRESSNGTGVDGSQTTYTSMQSGAAYVFVGNGAFWAQRAYLKASNPQAFDWFGYSVAVWSSESSAVVVVGAPEEDSNATGVNGNQNNNNGFSSGAVYAFDSSFFVNWTQRAYLKASNTGLSDNFGHSVALYDEMLVVGAPYEDSNATGVNGDQANNDASDSGAAYVFFRTGTSYFPQGYLKASNPEEDDGFGRSVAVSDDADGDSATYTIVVGARDEDSDGTQGNNNAFNSGAAYVFARSTGGDWNPQAYLKASNPGGGFEAFELADGFGSSVGISGKTVVIGAPGEASNATGVDGDQADNSLPLAGAAYVFLKTPGNYYSVPAEGRIAFGPVPVNELALRRIFISNNGPSNLCIRSIYFVSPVPDLTFAISKIGGGTVTLPHLIPPSTPSEGLEVSLLWIPSTVTDRLVTRLNVSYREPDCNLFEDAEVASYQIDGRAFDPLAVALEQAFLGWLYAGQPQGQAIRAAASPSPDAVQTVTLALDPSAPTSLNAQVPAFLGGGSVQLSNFTGSVTIALLSLPNDPVRKIIRIESGSLTAPSARLASGLMTGPNQLTFGPPEQSGGMLFLTNGSYTAYATATIVNNLIPDGVTVQGNYSGIYNAQTGGISLESASRDLFEPSERVLLNYSPTGLWLTWANTNTVEEATNVTGPWRTVTNAVSPHLVMTTNSQQFFRLRLPAP